MQRNQGDDCAVAEKNAPQLPPSSSGSSPSDPLLERLLGGIEKGLNGLVLGMDTLVQGNHELKQAFGDLLKQITQHHSRTENRVADLQVAVDTFVQRVEAVIEHTKTITGATVDAKRVLDESKKSFDRAIEQSGKHTALDPHEYPLAPKWSHRALDFIWPEAVRQGKSAVTWGVKLVAGSGTLAAVAKLIHMAITGHLQ